MYNSEREEKKILNFRKIFATKCKCLEVIKGKTGYCFPFYPLLPPQIISFFYPSPSPSPSPFLKCFAQQQPHLLK